MTREYDDIIHLPRHVSATWSQMGVIDRAAQFSPFATLTGHDAAIKETARLTDNRVELDECIRTLLTANAVMFLFICGLSLLFHYLYIYQMKQRNHFQKSFYI